MVIEIITTAFVVMVVVKCLTKTTLPESIRGLCIASAYFIASSATEIFSYAGNNPARSLALALVRHEWWWIFYFVSVPFVGSLLGLTLFMVLDIEKRKRVSQFYSENGWVIRCLRPKRYQPDRSLAHKRPYSQGRKITKCYRLVVCKN
jgi:hypothetical protein